MLSRVTCLQQSLSQTPATQSLPEWTQQQLQLCQLPQTPAKSSALPQLEPAQTSQVEPTLATSAPTAIAEPSVAMRTKQALLRGLALREASKKQEEPGEKGFVPNPVATPARSNTPPPIPRPVATPPSSNTPPRAPTPGTVVGSEDEVQAVADMLASAGNSDNEAGDATQHYETEYVFQDSECEDEAMEPDHDDGVSLSIRESSEEEGQPLNVTEPETAKEDLWLAEAEVARRFGRPAGWGQGAFAFLSPEMQEEPKPRGRKPGKKGKGVNKCKGESKDGEPCAEVAPRGRKGRGSKPAADEGEPRVESAARGRKKRLSRPAVDEGESCAELASNGRKKQVTRPAEDEAEEPPKSATRGRKRRASTAADDEEPERYAELSSCGRGRKKRVWRPAEDDSEEACTRGRKRRTSKAAEHEVEEPRARSRRAVKPVDTAEPSVARKSKRGPTPKPAPKAKRAPKTPVAAKSKPAAKAPTTSREASDSDQKAKLYKAKLSRKSAAYHRALKLARSEGKEEDLCRDLAREATS